MSQVPDIDYSPGINGLKISGCRHRALNTFRRFDSALLSAVKATSSHQAQKALEVLANQLTINKLRWFLGPLSHPSIGRVVEAGYCPPVTARRLP